MYRCDELTIVLEWLWTALKQFDTSCGPRAISERCWTAKAQSNTTKNVNFEIEQFLLVQP